MILSESEGFWCTWMCSKPFRYYRQLLNKSLFLIAYHPKKYLDFCSSRSQVQLWPENQHETQVFITEQCAHTCIMNSFLPSQAKCFNLLALEHWFTSEQNSACRRHSSGLFAVAFTRSYLWKFLGNSVWKSGAAFECKTLLWLLCLYHARHCRA